MEIEPDILEALVTHLPMHLFEVLADSLLGAFFVYQIDQSAVLVVDFDVFVVFPRYLHVDLVVAVNVDFWVPLEVRVLRPEVRDRASKLNMRKYVLFTAVLSKEYHLSLGRVRCVSIKIASSRQPSLPLPPLVSPRHQRNFTSVIYTRMRKVNHHKP